MTALTMRCLGTIDKPRFNFFYELEGMEQKVVLGFTFLKISIKLLWVFLSDLSSFLPI